MDLPNKNNWNSFWGDNKTSAFTKISWSKKRIMAVLDRYIKPGMSVLDAGCGSGYFSNFFLTRGCKVTALDYSKEALEIARKLTNGKASYVQGDLLSKEFCEKYKGKFDLIFSDGLFEHFSRSDQLKIMQNMKLMKSKKGVVTTFVPNKFSFWEVIRPIFMPQIEESPFVLKDLVSLNKESSLVVAEKNGLNVLPFKYSPEFFGRHLGMILFTIGK